MVSEIATGEALNSINLRHYSDDAICLPCPPGSHGRKILLTPDNESFHRIAYAPAQLFVGFFQDSVRSFGRCYARKQS